MAEDQIGEWGLYMVLFTPDETFLTEAELRATLNQ